jgi:tRNA modification GTPase
MTQATIAAIATPPGRGGIGIIRISGSKAKDAALTIIGTLPKPRFAHFGPFKAADGTAIDEGLAFYFPAPHSFTGEDVLELHGHGGPVTLDLLLKEILKLDIEMAKPGEFSQRAFLNDKLDLTQAEAIADLIHASSEQAALCAVRSLQGQFSKQVDELLKQLIDLRVYVEAAIDFPEEEIDFLSDGKIQTQLEEVLAHVKTIEANAKQGALLQEGITVVIAGNPNVGKSSLLNSLSGQDTAIVTDIPGTTRDVIRENIQINGIPLHIIDTAGLRESDDVVEQIGIQRAHDEINKADNILLLLDTSISNNENVTDVLHRYFKQTLPAEKITVIHNKIDARSEAASIKTDDQSYTHISLSAKTGEGLELLRQHISEQAGLQTLTENNFSARRRHLDALAQTQQHLNKGLVQLIDFQAGELLAEELRLAQDALSRITGAFLPDDLLGEIFSDFCIGK